MPLYKNFDTFMQNRLFIKFYQNSWGIKYYISSSKNGFCRGGMQNIMNSLVLKKEGFLVLINRVNVIYCSLFLFWHIFFLKIYRIKKKKKKKTAFISMLNGKIQNF